MRKSLLIALCAGLVAVTTLNAQNLKQSGNEKNLQVLFSPLSNSPVSLPFGGLSFRKFNATGDRAWRLNLFIGFTNNKDILQQAGDTNKFAMTTTSGNVTLSHGSNPELDKKTSTMSFSLRPGYEWHMPGTERLSPYCGVELLFSMTSKTVKTDSMAISDYSYTVTASSGPQTVSAPYKVLTLETKGDGASTTIGLNLVAGVDYYIAKSLSLGAEIGFGFSTTSMPDKKDQYLKHTDATNTVISPFSQTTTHSDAVANFADEKQGSSMGVGPNVIGQFKLGWLF